MYTNLGNHDITIHHTPPIEDGIVKMPNVYDTFRFTMSQKGTFLDILSIEY